MPKPLGKIRRFGIAYVGAALAAAAAWLIIYFTAVLWIERDNEALAYIWEVIPVYVIYSFGFTLGLGLIGWGLLVVLKQRSLTAYMAIGGILGFLAGLLGVTNGLTPANIYAYGFAGAGIAAAWTFHRLYTDPVTKEPLAEAAT
jgi:hypothetical protein